MDERTFPSSVGKPVPEWDLRHRLPIDRHVGPIVQDTGSIFRANSTFMDVTDQPYMSRQNAAMFAFTAGCIAFIHAAVAIMMWVTSGLIPDGFTLSAISAVCMFLVFFVSVAFKFGRDEFFALRRRPIRFNRLHKTIHAVRRRRFFAKNSEGDETWEAVWSTESLFCVHLSRLHGINIYHIRHYTVDQQGNVLQAFSIGREWSGDENLTRLLSQWNYWCEYMNYGPESLPKPALYFSECETREETFLFSLYHMCPDDGPVVRLLLMPFVALLAAFRLFGMWTCREHIWPKTVEAISSVPLGAYDQPSGTTPVGWGPTTEARESGTWPHEDIRKVDNWPGEPDPMKNALLWAEESAPLILPAASCKVRAGAV